MNLRFSFYVLWMTVIVSTFLTSGASENEKSILEDTKAYLICTAQVAVQSFTWQVQASDIYINVTKCYTNGNCTSSFPNYRSIYISNMTGGACTLELLVSRNMTIWRCVVDDQTLGPPFTIKAYVLPENFRCNTPLFAQSNTTLSITCKTDRVFPVPTCRLIQFPETGALGISQVTYNNPPSKIRPSDYSTECTFEIDLLPLNHTTTLNLTVTMLAVKDAEEVFDAVVLPLTYPEAVKGNDCPDDYIKSGTTPTCSCTLSTVGTPPGSVYWSSINAAKVETTFESSALSQLVIKFNSSELHPRYYCSSKSAVLQQKIPIVYEPKFAFGPSRVNLTPLTSLDVQFSNTTSVQFVCNVSVGQVVPGVIFHFMVTPGGDSLNWNFQEIDSFYVSSTFTFRPSSPGAFDITCNVQNVKFPTISAQSTLTVRAYGGTARAQFDSPSTTTVNQCSPTQILCVVDVNQVFPGTTAHIYINDELKKTVASSERDSRYLVTHQFVPPSVGTFTLYCVVINTQTGIELSKNTTTLTVSEQTCDASNRNILTLSLGIGLGGAGLILVIAILVFIRWRRRRIVTTRRPATQTVSFTLGDKEVKVIVHPKGEVERDVLRYASFPEPVPDYAPLSDYSRDSFGESIRTNSTALASSHNSYSSANESIYSTIEDYINPVDHK
ncbi:uncharacterized protein LOC106057542 isoform X1 [Biomphalaria glabrata]|uniref:Uncharacterized protein LOC106057542 isoform X1 n=1 Tax=Biomphalaria glabrata TaxID=6526 RepID=A0A9U8E3K2_BIOGL|nr:uncharacterized protein LOC106057542 isoform X1 [Biomphalaria glabrata]